MLYPLRCRFVLHSRPPFWWLGATVAVSLCWLPAGASRAAESSAAAAEGHAELTYERHVRPILKKHCFHCHGEGQAEGGLDVRLRRLLVEGGDSGPSIVPGDADQSYLVERLNSGEMPPDEVSLRPTAGELATIARWIDGGAATARPEPDDVAELPPFTEEERGYWAFQPIVRPEPPPVGQIEQVRTPIDRFLLARLEAQGLSLSAEADRATLIRRAALDLLGLPPEPEEVAAFVSDGRPDAYERMIERLLDSPHYGERWGRHWLDVAGYADSEGYNDDDTPREEAFRYRDYVIRALNADKPFDRFIVEQLAGDELARPPYTNLSPERVELLEATGFLRMAPDGTGTRNDDQNLARNAVVGETIKIVSSTLLGLSIGCAECHDHRFDPILQADYYRLRAVFEPALDWQKWREPRRRLISLLSDEQRSQAADLEKEARAVEARLQARLDEYRDWVFDREVEQLPAELQAAGRQAGLAWQRDPKGLTAEQAKLLDDYPTLKVAATQQRLNLFLAKYGRADELRDVAAEITAAAAAIRSRKPKEEFIRALAEEPGSLPVTRLFRRGDYKQPGEEIAPGELAVLSPDGRPRPLPIDDAELPTTGRRLELARRLTERDHPLVARVLVNRFWLHHFGQGIVATPADFGLEGQAPTHPELLDWLAAEFMDHGWSLKHLHRLMMTSAAYRQSSARHPRGEQVDVANTLYWRMPVRRLEAEVIRDAILATSGKLNRQMYGPPVSVSVDANNQVVVGGEAPSDDGQEYRRSIYVQQRRSAPAYMLSVFDSPQMEPNCEQRHASTVAPQSLLLLNSQFIVQQADHFARRVAEQAGDDPQRRVERAWTLAYGAPPTDDVCEQLAVYLDEQTRLLKQPQQALATLCQVLLGSNRFLYVD